MDRIIFLIIAITPVAIGFYYHNVRKYKIRLEALEKAKIKYEEEQRRLEIAKLHKEKQERLKWEHDNKKYQLQTHKTKYWLYNSYQDLTSGFRLLYEKVVHTNLWIEEPFHSKFYETLIVLDINEFMIVDPNSKVLTLHVRNKNNEMTVSNAYQVYSTKEIVETTISDVMNDVVSNTKHDAQNIVLAICILALEQSVHYQSNEVSEYTINDLVRDYKYANEVQAVISLIKYKNEKLMFVQNAFKEAFKTTATEAYNDSEVPKPLLLPKKLPQKFLQEI
jgi:hypothetical protein